MKLFVDTSAFYAIYVESDEFHSDAIKIVQKCTGQNIDFYTSNYVCVETISLLQKRIGMNAALKLAEHIEDYFHVCWVDKTVDQKIFSFWKKENRKDLSYADCSSFVLMKELGISKAFSFDAHFSKYGYELDF